MFILVEKCAVARFVHLRTAQSTEFPEGAALAHLLKERSEDQPLLPGAVRWERTANGCYIVGDQPDLSRTLVFDLDAADPFVEMSPEETLVVFQRALRFALKIWEGLAFSHSEYPVTANGVTKYVLFPFPIGSGTQLRLTIDRVHRSDVTDEDHLMAYRWARDEGAGTEEMPSRANLYRALGELPPVVERVSRNVGKLSGQVETPVAVTTLAARTAAGSGIAVPFANWLPLLTAVQRDFVQRRLVGAERLEGPAGTGKTLALMLKAVNILRKAAEDRRDYHALFLTHSLATKRAIEDRLAVIDSVDQFYLRSRSSSAQSFTVTTLQEWCGKQLGTGLGEADYLDRDAAESKALQQLYVAEALDEAIREHLSTHQRFMSEGFLRYLELEDRWTISEMMQHEIAVVIKGRAQEDLDRYRGLPAIQYNLPLENAADRGFVFLVYRGYARRLKETNQFDTDDIVLSAMNQLDTPIWRRRREVEGYDSIFIDEAHLFNLNELSIVHFLPRDPGQARIVFAIDRAQAVGDRGLEGNVVEQELLRGHGAADRTNMRAIFRSSPDILNLALAVTSSGATLFTNFDNPLASATSAFTVAEEELSKPPTVILVPSDEALVVRALDEASSMAERLPGGRSGVAVVVFDAALLQEFKRAIRERNRPFEVVERRGDVEVVNRARASGRFILASPEYIGGLEFDGVVIAGVDDGRVPPRGRRTEGKHFLRYAAHNLMYVAITRARYELTVIANVERGLSDILEPARQKGLLRDAVD